MELRSHCHLHFIQTINGNSVIKLLNVNRGRPALRFKMVKEIYEAEGTGHHEFPTVRPKTELESLLFDPEMVKFESPCLPLADRRTVNFDAKQFCCNGGKSGKSSSLDDFGFDNITLREIKETYKARKRKRAGYVDLSVKTSNDLLPSKQDLANSEAEEDELDLQEPLIRWKSKTSKSKNGKRKCIRSYIPTSSQSAILIVKAEQDPVDFLQPSGYLLQPTDIKLEVNELDCSNYQTNIHAAADSSIHCNEQVDSCRVVLDESRVTTSECLMETDASTFFDKEQTLTVNEASCEYMEHADPESVSDTGVSGLEIVNVDSPEILSYEYPDLPVANFQNELYIRPLLGDVSLETISMSKDHETDIYYNSQSLSTIHSLSWPSSGDIQVQASDMVINDTLQCMNILTEDGAYMLEDGKKDDLPSDIKASGAVIDCSPSWGLDTCLEPNTYLVSSADDSPLVEEKQPFLSACTNSLRSCSAAMRPSDATDAPIATAEAEDCHCSEPQCSPKRLLSTRKAISPTSQERLCKAMNSIELNDDRYSECRGKLTFGNQTGNKVIRAEGGNEIGRAEIASNAKQVHRKSKYDRNVSNTKANHLSRAVPGMGTGCITTQNLSQSAIAFSQRQMHDIESLATKLTAELSTMKELVKEMVHSDVCSTTSLKHNIAKVTMTIKNVTKAEETAKRWLSIMARDCNRFCKIMKLTEANSTAPGNEVHKERKRITFADEAGGKLCHVKVFTNDMISPSEPIDI